MNNTGLLRAQERPQETGIERHWREEAEREANAPQVTHYDIVMAAARREVRLREFVGTSGPKRKR